MFYDDLNLLEAKQLFEHFHMHVSYLKTLTKIDICSECMLSFRTLNEYILLVKRDCEIRRSLRKILSRARVNVPDAKF